MAEGGRCGLEGGGRGGVGIGGGGFGGLGWVRARLEFGDEGAEGFG
ncbi:hypothetical protein [Alloactinosynnema sp. L-07]|nr:hypothetical protein [Alloactinosynnema sp. L-07]